MKSTTITLRNLLPHGSVALIFGVCFWLSISSFTAQNPEIYIGIIYDLTITAPLVYLLFAWKTKLPNISAIPIAIIGYLFATSIIPEGYEQHFQYIEYFLLPALELGVIIFIFYTSRKVVRSYRKNDNQDGDFFTVLKTAAEEVLKSKKLGDIFATEISMISYSLFIWRKVKPTANQFTASKTSGAPAIYLALVFVLITETVIVHFLLLRWNVTVAWVVFALSIYAGLQILGHLKAITKRYTQINENDLIIKYGLAGDTRINFSTIKSIQLFESELTGTGVQKLALLGNLENHNILVELNGNGKLEKIYGIEKEYNKLLFYLDDPQRFIDQVNYKINEQATN